MTEAVRLFVKMPEEEKDDFRGFCKSIGEDMSEFTREAIREKKERVLKSKGVRPVGYSTPHSLVKPL